MNQSILFFIIGLGLLFLAWEYYYWRPVQYRWIVAGLCSVLGLCLLAVTVVKLWYPWQQIMFEDEYGEDSRVRVWRIDHGVVHWIEIDLSQRQYRARHTEGGFVFVWPAEMDPDDNPYPSGWFLYSDRDVEVEKKPLTKIVHYVSQRDECPYFFDCVPHLENPPAEVAAEIDIGLARLSSAKRIADTGLTNVTVYPRNPRVFWTGSKYAVAYLQGKGCVRIVDGEGHYWEVPSRYVYRKSPNPVYAIESDTFESTNWQQDWLVPPSEAHLCSI